MATVPAAPLQDEGGGQRHHTQRHPGQYQQNDELDLRQAGGGALAHSHLQQPVAMVTAVTADDGAAPLVLTPGGQMRSDPAWPPLPPRCGPQVLLAGGSSVAGLADAAETSGTIKAAAAVEAGPAGAVVLVDGAEASAEAGGAEAREAVDAIQAGGAIRARAHQAVVDVALTASPREASEAATRQLRREAVSVLAQTAVFTRRPADTTGSV